MAVEFDALWHRRQACLFRRASPGESASSQHRHRVIANRRPVRRENAHTAAARPGVSCSSAQGVVAQHDLGLAYLDLIQLGDAF